MPKRILIIDDRPTRPTLHLPAVVIEQLKQLPNVSLVSSIDESDYEAFDILAIHRSYVISAKLSDRIDAFLQNNSKYLILFSGGISQSIVSEKGRKAILGSESFYSSHLLPFCQELSECEDVQLYKLLYGVESWKLPLLLRLRHLCWIDPDNSDIDIEDEKDEIEDVLQMHSIDEVDKAIKQSIEVL